MPSALKSGTFQLSLAPQKLWQAINPWTFYQQGAQFGLINIDLGSTEQPETEQAILDRVGSYGKQLGHIGDALAVLLKYCDRTKFSQSEQDAVTILEGELAKIRQVKQETKGQG